MVAWILNGFTPRYFVPMATPGRCWAAYISHTEAQSP
jgi:hypothetical protein